MHCFALPDHCMDRTVWSCKANWIQTITLAKPYEHKDMNLWMCRCKTGPKTTITLNKLTVQYLKTRHL